MLSREVGVIQQIFEAQHYGWLSFCGLHYWLPSTSVLNPLHFRLQITLSPKLCSLPCFCYRHQNGWSSKVIEKAALFFTEDWWWLCCFLFCLSQVFKTLTDGDAIRRIDFELFCVIYYKTDFPFIWESAVSGKEVLKPHESPGAASHWNIKLVLIQKACPINW